MNKKSGKNTPWFFLNSGRFFSGSAPVLIWILLWSMCWSVSISSASVTKAMISQAASRTEKPADAVALPETIAPEQVSEVVARLDDQQVRRLLIEELRKDSALRSPVIEAGHESGVLAGFIAGVQDRGAAVRQRIDQLTSDGSGKALDLPESLKKMADGGPVKSWLHFAALVLLILIGGALGHLVWGYLLNDLRKRIQTTPGDEALFVRLWRLFQRAFFLDAADIALFVGATLVVYSGFAEGSRAGRLFLLAYVIAIVIVGLIRMVSRLILAPGGPGLRFLPMDNQTAVYLHRRVMGIAVVGAFGWLTCGLFRLQHAGEAFHLAMVALVGLVIVLMLAVVVLRNRKRLSHVLTRGIPEGSLWLSLARNWHRLVIVYMLLFWGVWAIVLLLVGSRAVLPAMGMLLSLPVFFLLDQLLQGGLNLVFRIVNPAPPKPLALPKEGSGGAPPAVQTIPTGLKGREQADLVQLVIRRTLRIVLGTLIVFWLLELWEIHLPVGEALSKAAFSTIVTILLGYVAWELIKAPIQRRLLAEMPEDDEEMEEGGSGGSRIGTLLLLLRKFILCVLVVLVTLIVLSSIGIDIGPLIAGAGVVGLAIGFGAQTLVKDIISGIFFLVDDAFRVGDYIDTGSVQGTVEHISLRSMRLRHARGMVHTLPFGDIQVVTNASRDYIISKLSFRVRYDTDVNKVRKIIKNEVYNVILKNDVLAGKLLGKIKSQGVRGLDDSAMVMRVKFKSLPGEQFILRQEVYRLMQEAFRAAGIEFAHRNVTVYLPPEGDMPGAEKSGEKLEKMKSAVAGAAALAAEPAAAKDKEGA